MPSMRNQDVGPYEESRRKFGLCRKLQQGAVQEGEDTDIVREERASGSNEEGGRHHPERVGESDGDKDGGLFRDTEGALWPETEQGEDKARTRLTEILYIFFGIHTANVVQLVRGGNRRNCPGRLMFRMWNGIFTGVLAPVVSENEKIGSNTKPTI